MKLMLREAGEGPPVLLLHGLFGLGRNLATLQASLSPHHRTLTVDLRNHGTSPHAAGMSYQAMADDVRETLAERGIDRCAVLGHSMGGKVAMMLALTAPERVSRLLVADIAPARMARGFESVAQAMQDVDLAAAPNRAAADAALLAAVPDATVRAFLLQNFVPGAPARWRLGLAEIAAGIPEILDWPAVDGVYDGPVLFVAGGQSDYIRAEHRAPIDALFPRARMITLRQAGHWLHADAPADFAAIVLRFFA